MNTLNPVIYIICCCRNAEKWIQFCLKSIQEQTYKNYVVSLYFDQSTDNTEELARLQIGTDTRFVITNSTVRKFAALARWDQINALNEAKPHDIIVLLDGDDWLSDENAFAHIIEYYSTKKVVATHGNYKTDKGQICDWSADYPIAVKVVNEFRINPWIATHLRTFKFGLMSYLTIDCILNEEGKPFKSGTDMALFMPILELSGLHSGYINRVLYVYNERSGAAMSTSRILAQLKNELIIRNKKPLLPLSHEIIKTLTQYT